MQDTFRPSQSLFPSNTALVIIALFILALIGSWNFYLRNIPAISTPIVTPTPLTIVMTPTPEATAQPSVESEQRISGAITQADTGCFADGICKIMVNGTWVILATGERLPTNPPVESGVLLGLDGISPASIGDMSVGRSVEVYAAQSPTGELTLQGKNAYYVRLLN